MGRAIQLAALGVVLLGAAPDFQSTKPNSSKCSAGEVHDDGTVDSGLSSGTPTVVVDEFTPLTYPFVYKRVCLCLFELLVPDTGALRVVAYDDDGPNGTPGTRIADERVTAMDVPRFPGQFYSFDLSRPVTVSEGSVYIGMAWVDQVLLCFDSSLSTPVHEVFIGLDGSDHWRRANEVFPQWRASMVRAEGNPRRSPRQ